MLSLFQTTFFLGFLAAKGWSKDANDISLGISPVDLSPEEGSKGETVRSVFNSLFNSDGNQRSLRQRQRRLFNEDGQLTINGGPSASFDLPAITGGMTSPQTQIYRLLADPVAVGDSVTCILECTDTSGGSPAIYLRVGVLYIVSTRDVHSLPVKTDLLTNIVASLHSFIDIFPLLYIYSYIQYGAIYTNFDDSDIAVGGDVSVLMCPAVVTLANNQATAQTGKSPSSFSIHCIPCLC